MPHSDTGDTPSPLHVFRFGDDGRMYVHGEEVVLVSRLLTDAPIEAMVLAAAMPVHDDGHTDTYYRGLMRAAINAASRTQHGTED